MGAGGVCLTQDVVHLLDAVHLGEQLVDHAVADARRVARERAPFARERVDLVEDDDLRRARRRRTE